MIFGNYSLKKAFKEQEGILTRNIAHDLFQLEFHRTATDEQLALFYGAEVDRDQLLLDTERKLDGDQRLLAYFRSIKHQLIHEYGTQDALADFSGAARSGAGETAGSDSDAPGTEEAGSGDAGQGGADRLQSADHAAEGDNDRGPGEDERGSGQELGDAPGGTGSDDGGADPVLTHDIDGRNCDGTDQCRIHSGK